MQAAANDRVAVVTGAGRGLGREAAVALAARGHPVVGVARSATQLAETAAIIGAAGGQMLVRRADVSDPGAVAAMAAFVRQELGPPSILINAAGIFGPIALIRDSDPAAWIETLMTDAVAPYLTTQAFVGDMIDAGWGRIVNITSAASLHPPGALNSAYATAKVALNQLTRHVAVRGSRDGRHRERHPSGRREDGHVAGHPRSRGDDGVGSGTVPPMGGLGRSDRWRPAGEGSGPDP